MKNAILLVFAGITALVASCGNTTTDWNEKKLDAASITSSTSRQYDYTNSPFYCSSGTRSCTLYFTIRVRKHPSTYPKKMPAHSASINIRVVRYSAPEQM